MQVLGSDGCGRSGLCCRRSLRLFWAARTGAKKTAPRRRHLVLPAPGGGDNGGVCHGSFQRSFLFGTKLWEDPGGKDKRLCALAIMCSFSGSSCLATLGLCPPASGFLSQQEDRPWLETHNRASHQGRTNCPSLGNTEKNKGPESLQAWIGFCQKLLEGWLSKNPEGARTGRNEWWTSTHQTWTFISRSRRIQKRHHRQITAST